MRSALTRTGLLLIASALLLGGCAGIVRPSDLRPASHPLLEGVAPRSRLLPLAAHTRDAEDPPAKRAEAGQRPPDADEPAAPSAEHPDAQRARAAILARLDELIGQRTIAERPASDVGLLRAAVVGIDGVRDPGATLANARRSARRVGRPAPGDLAFFHGAGGAAEVAIVRGARADGAIEAVAVTRGAVRPIVLDPADPHSRRRDGRIVNTFLRARRHDDEAGAVYLAAQLLVDFRTLVW